jgi:hypothetical protein
MVYTLDGEDLDPEQYFGRTIVQQSLIKSDLLVEKYLCDDYGHPQNGKVGKMLDRFAG